jgi:hypothetical protein
LFEIICTINRVRPIVREKPVFDGILRVIGSVEESTVVDSGIEGILTVIEDIPEKRKYLNLFEIICVINRVRPLISEDPGLIGVLQTMTDISEEPITVSAFDGILQVLSDISSGPVKEGEKVCKVIEYINQDGEKETLYPFAVIQGQCYYYNKNRDILNEDLEIVKNY